MAAEISDRVREIADARGVPESEVFEQALKLGIADLWENVVLGKYVDGELSREEAIELVGPKISSEPIAKQQPLKRILTGVSTRDDWFDRGFRPTDPPCRN